MARKWAKQAIDNYRAAHDGAYPSGQEPDPSADWLDTLAEAKRRWSQEMATRQDSFALGRLPLEEKKIEPRIAWLNQLAISKDNIARGVGTKLDSARVFMGQKPEKPEKPESPSDAQIRYIKELERLITSHEKITSVEDERGKIVEGFLHPEGSAARKAIEDKIKATQDSLVFAAKAKALGVKNINYMAALLREVKAIMPEFLTLDRKDPKAADEFLLKEVGMTREQVQNFMDTFK